MNLFSRPDYAVLFVCTANICRSPIAHGLLQELVRQHGLNKRVRVESAGTHVGLKGQRPDPRAQSALASRGVDISRLRARPFLGDDFDCFDNILVMDRGHLSLLQAQCPLEPRSRVELIMDYARHHDEREVPDPYFGNEAGFDGVITLLEDAVTGFLEDSLLKEFESRGVM